MLSQKPSWRLLAERPHVDLTHSREETHTHGERRERGCIEEEPSKAAEANLSPEGNTSHVMIQKQVQIVPIEAVHSLLI